MLFRFVGVKLFRQATPHLRRPSTQLERLSKRLGAILLPPRKISHNRASIYLITIRWENDNTFADKEAEKLSATVNLFATWSLNNLEEASIVVPANCARSPSLYLADALTTAIAGFYESAGCKPLCGTLTVYYSGHGDRDKPGKTLLLRDNGVACVDYRHILDLVLYRPTIQKYLPRDPQDLMVFFALDCCFAGAARVAYDNMRIASYNIGRNAKFIYGVGANSPAPSGEGISYTFRFCNAVDRFIETMYDEDEDYDDELPDDDVDEE